MIRRDAKTSGLRASAPNDPASCAPCGCLAKTSSLPYAAHAVNASTGGDGTLGAHEISHRFVSKSRAAGLAGTAPGNVPNENISSRRNFSTERFFVLFANAVDSN